MASRWTAADIPDQTGRTFLVTGANSGLGFETARRLAEHGAHVVMTARTQSKGEAAVARLLAELPESSVELRLLDLSDLDSVRSLAESLLADGVSVDVLVNNAGVMMPPRSLTPQGFELQFATNHLGHFALTGLLLDKLREGRDPRVVTVSSTMHKGGTIRFDDLDGSRSYSPTAAYSQSKFANVLFALELQRRLEASGSPVRSILAHPGYTNTNLQLAGPTGFAKLAMRLANPVFGQDVKIGALPQLLAATEPAAKGGKFYGPTRLAETRGYPAEVQPTVSAQDPDLAARLWTVSEELTGVAYRF